MTEKYYFDANALLKYYRDEKGSLNVQLLVASARPIYISPLTWLEYLSTLKKIQRKGDLKAREFRRVWKRLRDDVSTQSFATSRPFCELPMPDGYFRTAGDILLKYGDKNFGTHDALHIAIAQLLPNQPIFVTSDKALKNVCKQINLPCYDPEIQQI